MIFNDYKQETSASGLIRSLDWDMLSTRRKISRVNLLHKAIGGTLALPVSTTYVPQLATPDAQTLRTLIYNSAPEQTVFNIHLSPVPSRIGMIYHLTSKA